MSERTLKLPPEAADWNLDLGKPEYKSVSRNSKVTILGQRFARLMNKNSRRITNGLPPKMKYSEI
jgi:hypothetical protein